MARSLDMYYIRKQEKDEGLNKDKKAPDEEMIEMKVARDILARVPEDPDDDIIILKGDTGATIGDSESTESKRIEPYSVTKLKMELDILEEKFAELGESEYRDDYDDCLFEIGELDESTYLANLEAEKQRMETKLEALIKSKSKLSKEVLKEVSGSQQQDDSTQPERANAGVQLWEQRFSKWYDAVDKVPEGAKIKSDIVSEIKRYSAKEEPEHVQTENNTDER